MKLSLVKFLFYLLLIQSQVMGQSKDDEQIIIDVGSIKKVDLSFHLYRARIEIKNGKSSEISITQRVIDYEAYIENKLFFINDRLSNVAKLEIEKTENRVLISNSKERNIIELIVTVPETASTTISVSHYGLLELDGIVGDLDLEIFKGGITILNNKGSVSASIIRDGNIFFSAKPEIDAVYVLSTYDGEITVQIPKDTKAKFDISTDMGSISNSVLKFSRMDSVKFAMDIKGKEKIGYSYWYEGELNGGGAQFMLKNVKGNILIKER